MPTSAKAPRCIWTTGSDERPAPDREPVTDPVALVLSRQVRPAQEQAFEEVLHRLASAVRSQPGHLDVTVPQPAPGGPPIDTIVSQFRTRADAEAWHASRSGRGWSPRLACMPLGSCRRGTPGSGPVPSSVMRWRQTWSASASRWRVSCAATSAGLPWATSASISASLPAPLRSSSVQPSRRRLLAGAYMTAALGGYSRVSQEQE